MEPAESPRLGRRDRGGAFGGANLLGTSPEELELSEEKTSFGNLGPGEKISSFPRLGLGALRRRDGMRGKRQPIDKDELSEDYCFVCKDGGDIRVCDFKNCLKSYHPDCVNKDDSFLESNERWTCGWHSCYNCSRSSSFKCYCCPYSSCRTCIEKAEFVQVKGAKGFCTNCLRLAKLIEENCDVNSDGEKVDFNDTETYEFLFKDYWAILNEKERLTLDHVRSAYTHLKSGEKFNDLSDSDEPFEQQPDAQLSEVDCEAESSPSKHLKRKHKMIGAITEKSKSRKKTYIGWASKELIEFLSYMGRDTKQALGQHDVYEIVKNYIQTNNLLRFDKKKKKHVFCDATLHSLFRRKKINFFKVYSLLESHFSANVDTEDESLSFGEDDYSQHSKWQRHEKGDSRSKIEKKHFVEHALDRKNCFAAIIEDNIKTIYLKRSLIVELMADLQTFEMKVLGCFVRRKNDPKDFYGTPQKMYQLDQITGVKKVAEAYKLGDMTMDIVLRVSNYWKDVKISMLSDDGFEEDECEDLRQLVKKGLFKRPVIDGLEEKIGIIHEDIVKHSVKKELLKLDKLIDRANEKGWRKELFDYIDRRKLLSKPEEVMRLVKDLPKITADTEADATELREVKDGNTLVSSKNANNPNAPDGPLGNLQMDAAFLDKITAKTKVSEGGDRNFQLIDVNNGDKIVPEEKSEGHKQSALKETVGAQAVIEINDEEEAIDMGGTSDIEIIDLDATDGNHNVRNDANLEKIWNYMDPSGNVQGPFSLRTLTYWKDEGFFDEDFRIWRASQSQEDAITLGAALGL